MWGVWSTACRVCRGQRDSFWSPFFPVPCRFWELNSGCQSYSKCLYLATHLIGVEALLFLILDNKQFSIPCRVLNYHL